MSEADPIVPLLEHVVREAVEARLRDVHTVVPGQIVTYDPAKQRATVKVLLRRVVIVESTEGEREETVEYPPITEVPVIFPRGGGWRMHWPLNPGDPVELRFAERDLSTWLNSGGVSTPADTRTHDLSDGIATPGLSSFASPQPTPGPGLVIGKEDGSAELRFNDDGSIVIKGVGIQLGANATERALLGDAFASLFAGHTHAYVGQGGPALTSPPTTSPAGTPLPAPTIDATKSNTVKVGP